MSDEFLFTASTIRKAFDRLSEILEQQHIVGEVFMVGGGAMILAYDARVSTQDIDAVFHPTGPVRRAALQVALEQGLPDDWLNDGAKGFMPGPDRQPVPTYEGPGLRVASGSPPYILAMKLMAFRDEKDVDDIRFLMHKCALESVEEALDLMQEYYPHQQLSIRSQLKLEEMLGQQARREAAAAPVRPRMSKAKCGYQSVHMSGPCKRPPHHSGSHKSNP